MSLNIERRSRPPILGGFLVFIIVFFLGVWGYVYYEEYTLLESLYMTIITISTVGFGELRPLSENGRIFTMLLILVSLGNLAYFGTVVVQFVIEGELVEYLKKRRVIKRIHKLENHVIVYGYGRNGEQACLELADNGLEFVVIENRPKVWPRLEENKSILHIKGDPSDDNILMDVRIDKAKAIIMTAPDDADNVFAVLAARELNENITIISRAASRSSESKLRRAGANNIILPERMGGQRMAKLVIQPDVVEFLEHILIQNQSEVIIHEVSCIEISEIFVEQHLDKIYKKNNSNAKIIGVKSGVAGYTFNPPSTYIVNREDQFFVLGRTKDVDRFKIILRGE